VYYKSVGRRNKVVSERDGKTSSWKDVDGTCFISPRMIIVVIKEQ
jgi:hypothetical protein